MFPDLFVIGAQKCGTTSLCAWLDALEGIAFTRPKEPMLVSRDDIALHPHFFAQQPEAWDGFSWPEAASSYAQYLSHAPAGALLADGSTSYFYAETAPDRIYTLNPQARLVVLLRDPARRAYSAYQHYLREGTACESFARHLQYENGYTIRGSEYRRHLARWLAVFPRAQCHVMLYEALRENPAEEGRKLLDFIGLSGDPGTLPRENTGGAPRSLRLQYVLNRLARRQGAAHSAIREHAPRGGGLLARLSALNRSEAPYPPMDAALHRRLDRYFRRVNAGLDALSGLDTERYWYQGPA